jgi:lipoteichoic acid synthase
MSLSAANRFISTKPFLFFSLIMVLKSYLAYLVIFDAGLSSLWRPLLNELPFVWVIFCLIEWFAAKRKIVIYMIVNLLLTGLMFAVIMYFQYYGVIATYHALNQANQVTAVSNSVFSLLHPYFLLIFTDIILLAVLMLRSRNRMLWSKLSSQKTRKSVLSTVFIVSIVICMMNVLPNRASMNEIKKASEMGILNYEAYTILDQEKPELVDKKLITQETINDLKSIQEPASPVMTGAAKGKNVIILQMESLQSFLIGLKLNGKEITPNLNKLAASNFYFPHFFQNVGQGNTSDAEFVVNTSFYIPPVGAATTQYVDRELPSMPRTFAANGYDTATFHTNIVEFWNRAEMYKALGFNRYYDEKFFGDEDRVFFSASDEVLYRKTSEELKKMNETGKPFYTHIISETAHHPFTIPESKYKMTLPDKYEGTLVGDYIRAQNYADYALGQFIQNLKDNGVWDDSLLLLYGDHQGLPIFSLDSGEKELMAEIYGHEYSYGNMINIPLIIASPGITYPAEFTQLGGQIDIFPTVANLTGISLKDHLHFGQDLLNQSDNLIPERYYLPSGSIVGGKTLFIPGNEYEDGTAYSLFDGSLQNEGLTKEQYDNALKLLHYSDSYVRQLPEHK